MQISESIELAPAFALSGGFMDAYSYIGRGGVLLMHKQEICFFLVYIFRKEIFLMRFDTFVRFLLSLLELRSDIVLKLRKRRASTLETDFCLLQKVILAIVSFFPQSHNLLANSLTSLACGIQVETSENSWQWYCYNHVYRKSSKRYTKYLHFLPDKETGFS